MIVVDSSAFVELLLGTSAGDIVARRILESREPPQAPHLLDIEVAHVIRRAASVGDITPERGREALDALADFPLRRYAHDALLPRVWGLRNNFSAYDAAYIALAEVLGAPLLTRDRRLANASGHRARIELV